MMIAWGIHEIMAYADSMYGIWVCDIQVYKLSEFRQGFDKALEVRRLDFYSWSIYRLEINSFGEFLSRSGVEFLLIM